MAVRRRRRPAPRGLRRGPRHRPARCPAGGDIDLLHRVLRAGLPLVYEPRAVVFHRHRRDADGLRRQYDSWGRSLMAFATKTYRRDPRAGPSSGCCSGGSSGTKRGEARPGAGRTAATRRWPSCGAGSAACSAPTAGRVRRIGPAAPDPGRADGGHPAVGRRRRGLHSGPRASPSTTTPTASPGGWLFGFAAGPRAGPAWAPSSCAGRRAVERPTRRIHLAHRGDALVPAAVAGLPRGPAPAAPTPTPGIAGRPRRPAGAGGAAAPAAARRRPYLTATPVRLAAGAARRRAAGRCCARSTRRAASTCASRSGRVLRLPVFATFQGGDHTRHPARAARAPPSVRAGRRRPVVVGAEREAERVVAALRRPGPTGSPACRTRSTRPPSRCGPRGEARAALGLPAAGRGSPCGSAGSTSTPRASTCCSTPGRRCGADAAAAGHAAAARHRVGGRVAARAARRPGSTTCCWRDEYVLDREVDRHLPLGRPTCSCCPPARRASRSRPSRPWPPGCRWWRPTHRGCGPWSARARRPAASSSPREDASRAGPGARPVPRRPRAGEGRRRRGGPAAGASRLLARCRRGPAPGTGGRAGERPPLAVSVVVPTIGPAATCSSACLRSVLACDPPADDVVVVDQSGGADVAALVGRLGRHGVRCAGCPATAGAWPGR